MEEKLLTVLVDNVPTFNLSLNKLQTIQSVKKFLYNKYPDYNIKLYINDDTQLKVWNTSKYDEMNFKSVWDNVNNGRIELNTHKSIANKKTTTQSVKVSHLRKVYGKDMNLKTWLENPENVYVGRRGRIFINGEIFHYPQSQWANPFKASEYSLSESLSLYSNHLKEKGLLTEESLKELKGKTLGCFCDTASTTDSHILDCHTKVLLREILKYCE